MEKTQLPDAFLAQMQHLLGSEAALFLDTLSDSVAPVSVRLHPRKLVDGLFPEGTPIPWCQHARWLAQRPTFTLDPCFHAGNYYVQEASSMLIWEALQHCLGQPIRRVLDLCAAPGGKTTLLLDAMPDQVLVVANEVIRARYGVLKENLEKWGHSNTAVLSDSAEKFAELGESQGFDLILVDAPCSGEGLFRRDPQAASEWSPAHVQFCSARQRSILAPVIRALRPGGFLLFSTCTYNTTENGENVDWLLRDFPEMEQISMPIPSDWGFVPPSGGAGSLQAYPHKVRGEGFFLSMLRKNASGAAAHSAPKSGKVGSKKFAKLSPLPQKETKILREWVAQPEQFAFFTTPNAEVLALPEALLEDYLVLDAHFSQKQFGTLLGTFKGQDFVPDQALAHALLLKKDLPVLNLDLKQALLFLKRETFEPPTGAPQRGWALASYLGQPLGWVKCLPGRINNYLPKGRRILMELPE